jgi:hypothetical protein
MTDTLVADKTAATSGVIHLGDVSKVFGKEGAAGSYRAVDHLNLDVAPGLYVYQVEAPGVDPFIGKFAVIK